MDTIAADDLIRNSRVVLDLDDAPHLVDSVLRPAGTDRVQVRFSSGEHRDYSAREPVVTV